MSIDDSEFYKQNTLPDYTGQSQAPSPLPVQIGPYKIESLLSRGGMSFLYLGLHPDTRQLLTIKVLSPKFVTHPEAISRFLKEANIIGISDHPNIVKLYGEGEWEEGLYIAMEFIRGVSLRQFILQQSLSLRRSIDIILQVAYALLHLHSHGIIHRDLKPENILIDEEGLVKVIDFGIAQLHEEKNSLPAEDESFMGTPTYMSPEQKENPQNVTFSSDIYSLAIITYELVLGKLSYGVLNLSLLPKGLRKIVEKSLAISPSERYQDIVDFISDLTQYLRSEELQKERPHSDPMKEFVEQMQKTHTTLSPSSLPNWPTLELGLAKPRETAIWNLYYDFFRLPDSSFLLIIAESKDSRIDSTSNLAMLRGLVRSYFALKSNTPFQLLAFVTFLNDTLYSDPLKLVFGCGLLHLSPNQDELRFLSCGLGGLLHTPRGGIEPRMLTSENPFLGEQASAVFFETVDNWQTGDRLLFYAWNNIQELLLSQSALLRQSVATSLSLSAQGQAEAVVKKIAQAPSVSKQKPAKLILSIQRLS